MAISSCNYFILIQPINSYANLILYNTNPLGNILMYTFGIIMLWKWPSFSLEKNKSGIHTLLASVKVKYFILPIQTTENISLFLNQSLILL